MKKIIYFVCIAVLIISLAEISTYAADSKKDTWQYLAANPVDKPIYNWRLQSAFSTDVFTLWHKAFAEDLTKKTGGRIVCKAYKTRALVGPKQIIYSVKDGAIELGVDFGAYHSGAIPMGNFLAGLPYAFETPEQYNEFWWDWRGKLASKVINKEAYHPQNIHFLGTIGTDYCMYGNFEIHTADGLKGKKLSFFGPFADMVMQFGAATVSIPGPERYGAMQRGTIDGGHFPAYSFVQYKAIEVSKYFYLPPLGNIGTHIYINYSLWKNLSPALQDAIYCACREHAFKWFKYYKEKLDKPALEEIGRRVKIITLPDSEVQKLREAAKKSWKKFAAKSEATQKIYELTLEFGREKGYIK